MSPAARTGAVTAVLAAAARSGDKVRLRFVVPGNPDLTAILARRDGTPAWAETRHLAVRHEGSTLTPDQERVLRAVVEHLGDTPFEALARRVPSASPEDSGEGKAAAGPAGEAGGTPEVLTVDPWGHPDRWRRFRFRREFERNASSAIRILDAGAIVVSHGEAECRYATPRIDGRTMSMLNYPWVRPLERPLPDDPGTAATRLPPFISTDLRDADVISGGTARLDAVLEALAPRTRAGDLVLVKSTCVPQVIGDDMEGAVARWRGRGRIRFQDVFAPAATDSAADLLAEAIAAGRRRRRRGPAAALAGLARGGDAAELIGLLADAGIDVVCSLLPEIELAAAARWRDADVQVLVPNPFFGALYDRVFARLPMPTIAPAAPYGFAASRAWLGAVARACGRSREMARAWRAARPRWDAERARLRAEASRRRLGFVIAPSEYDALCDPAGNAGIPPLDVIVEFGFGIDLLVFDDGSGAGLSPRPAHAGATVVHRFGDPASLAARLRDAPCDAVYSDLYGDERITAAGKTPFSLQSFEPGPSGALRTAERLLAACRLPFYRKYPRHAHAT